MVTKVDSVDSAKAVVLTESAGTMAQYLALKVQDAPTYQLASNGLNDVRRLLKRAEDIFGPVIRAGLAAHKAALAGKQEATADLVRIESALLAGMRAFDTAQARVIREAEAAAAKAEADRREAARKAAALDALAAQADREGDRETAQVVREVAAETVAAVTAPVFVPVQVKAAGMSAAKTYSAVVQEPGGMAKLVRAIASGQVALEAVMPNMTFLNFKARQVRKEGEMVPGVDCVGGTNYRGKS